ncbi:AbiTii domain-containing protein [Herbaspirillum frisingense]|uniref:AbiTii domain-containing protein n=1 Tax=Herbaspirillum frisingense TaxID=92645 RepID=A0ABU1PD23_9BURK|nr:hypothetical protein [Herbaspirillum frisingense]MDR6583827.1 hypothetical protein [Herbaspirillum frisingense]
MASLVHELVEMANDRAVSVADLLRRSLVAASRLDLVEVTSWLTDELNGYQTGEVPEYRRLRGELMVHNPYNGLVPLHLPVKEAKVLSESRLAQSIPQLEELLHTSGTLVSRFSHEIEQKLMKRMDMPFVPYRVLQVVQLRGVVEAVRSRVLAWSLDLERQGVLGEGMVFTTREKEMSREGNNQFNITANGAQIQIGSNGSSQSMQTGSVDPASLAELISALTAAVVDARAAGEHIDELLAEIATLRAQQASPKPKISVIREAAKSIRTILEGAGGNVLAELAKPHVTALFSLAAS